MVKKILLGILILPQFITLSNVEATSASSTSNIKVDFYQDSIYFWDVADIDFGVKKTQDSSTNFQSLDDLDISIMNESNENRNIQVYYKLVSFKNTTLDESYDDVEVSFKEDKNEGILSGKSSVDDPNYIKIFDENIPDGEYTIHVPKNKITITIPEILDPGEYLGVQSWLLSDTPLIF